MIRKGNPDTPYRATFTTHKAAELLSVSKSSSLVFILVGGRSNETKVCKASLSLSLQTVIQPSPNGPGQLFIRNNCYPYNDTGRMPCTTSSKVWSTALDSYKDS